MKYNNIFIGLVGFIDSGKGTVGNIISEKYNFKIESFASPIKDITALLFNWDKDKLEGQTLESRKWRTETDKYWSKILGIKKFNPRLALQMIGTDAIRDQVHNDIWVLSLLNRCKDINNNIVITDCRYLNEIDVIRKKNGYIIHIQKGENPLWYNDMADVNNKIATIYIKNQIQYKRDHKKIPHITETAWVGCKADYILYNNKTIEELDINLAIIMNDILEKHNINEDNL